MKSIKEMITIGKQYFDNKEFSKAEQYLQDVLNQGARYADVLNMMGVIAHVQGKFASAIDCFKKALEINPRYTEAVLNLAVLYNDLGQYEEAKKLYGSLKRQSTKAFGQIEPVLRGKLSNLHADIGDIYRSIGLHKYAIDEYRKALELNPDYFDIRTKLGQALREQGRLGDSLKEFKKVLDSDSSYCPALIQQGITFYTMNRTSEAKKSWNSALEKDADNKYAQMYLRLCSAMSGSPRMKAVDVGGGAKKTVKSKPASGHAKKAKRK